MIRGINVYKVQLSLFSPAHTIRALQFTIEGFGGKRALGIVKKRMSCLLMFNHFAVILPCCIAGACPRGID